MMKNDSASFLKHLIFHPISGFWDLKWEKKGRLSVSLIVTALALITYIIKRCYTGFIFNTTNIAEVNIPLEIVALILIFILWSASNWCLTSLMNGKGTFRDIVIATGYTLLPYSLINLPLVFLSRFMVNDESVFFIGLTTLSVVWCAVLLLFSVMMTHDYSLKKTIATIICIIIGMAIMLFLCMLLFSILQKIFRYLYAVYVEISYRI